MSRVLLGLCLAFSACASPLARTPAMGDPALREIQAEDEGCRPLFSSGALGEPEDGRRHSCWHRLWEVPAALVVYPVAAAVIIGLATAPIWAPILLIK